MESRGNWTDLIAGVGLEISEVFDQGQEEYLPGIASILMTGTGTGAQRNVTGKTGAGKLEQFSDGDDIPGGRRYKTYTTDIVYNNYGKHLVVTANTIADRDWGEDLDEMKDLSVGANYSQDEAGMQLFNGSFATTAKVNGYTMNWYGDGKPQFSTVHPTVVPGASTQSNASATGIAFGHDSLEVGKLAKIRQQTDDGMALSKNGKDVLVVPPALEREGQEELNSVLTPESAENAINVYKGSADMVTSLFLDGVNGGSNTAWFLLTAGRHKLGHEVRQAPVMGTDVAILSKIVTFTVDARWANYSKEWKRTWGSNGDLAAYSS